MISSSDGNLLRRSSSLTSASSPSARTFEGDLLRRADTGDHVFALGIDQEFAVEQVFARARVAREGDAGAAVVAQIAEDHRLHVDGGAPGSGNVVQLAIDLGAVVVPALEHGHHGAPELFPRIGREFAADAGADQPLKRDHSFRSSDSQIGIELDALLLLDHVDDDFEGVVIFLRYRLEAHDHVAVHLDEAAIRVPGETLVARLARQPATASSLRPRLRMVSIMPGIEAREPERTESSSGSAGRRTSCPFPVRRRRRPAATWLRSVEHRASLPLLGVDGAGFGADRETRRHGNPRRHISARLAPLPPSRFFILASPSVGRHQIHRRSRPIPGRARPPPPLRPPRERSAGLPRLRAGRCWSRR
jgi:hypothetical protein